MKFPQFLSINNMFNPEVLTKEINFFLIITFNPFSLKIETPIKLVFLVRDPRGVMSSRYRMNWCINSANCTDVEVLCQRMRDDINALIILNKWSESMYRIYFN